MAGGSAAGTNRASGSIDVGAGGAAVCRPGHRDGFPGRDPAEEVNFASGQRTKLARRQTFQRDRADRDPGQHHDLVAEFGEHPPDLAVLAFGQDHFEDRRVPLLRHGANPLGPNLPLGQPDPLGQLVEGFPLGRAGHDDPVELLDTEPGVGQFVGQFAIVGQEHEADAHLVEPTHGINPLSDLGHQVKDTRASRWVVVRGDIALRLVNREVDQALPLDLLTVHGDRDLGQINLGAKFTDDLAADADATLEDHLLAGATGADPGMRQDFLKSIRARITLGGSRLAGRTGLGPRRLSLAASLGTGTF